MAQRRTKGDDEGLTDEQRLWKLLDFYATPPWAARAGAEIAQALWPDARVVREPACGQMHMAGPLAEYFEVLPSDVHSYSPNTPIRDWLDPYAWEPEPDCDLVLTNPPFNLAKDFVERGLARARLGVGVLVRTVWVESEDRYGLFEGGEHPLTLLCPFSERVPMVLGPWDPAKGTATSYSWLFWSKGAAPLAPRWIKPGTRSRLWKRDDVERYGLRAPLPLFPDPGDVI